MFAKASSKHVKGWPEMVKAIDVLGYGEVLVLAEWERATRSMHKGITIMQRLHAREMNVNHSTIFRLAYHYTDKNKPTRLTP